MKSRILLSLVMLVALFSLAESQTAPKDVVLKPTFFAGDIVYVVNVLNSIEISGREVDQFLEVKNFYIDKAKEAQEAKKKTTDEITIEVPLLIAQNTSAFLERAKITADKAEIYKRFMNSLVKAAEEYSKKNLLKK